MRPNIVTFLAGLGAGAALGLLCAPVTGREARGLIANKTTAGTEAVKTKATDLWNSASHAVDEGRSELLRQREGLKAAFGAGIKAYRGSDGQAGAA